MKISVNGYEIFNFLGELLLPIKSVKGHHYIELDLIIIVVYPVTKACPERSRGDGDSINMMMSHSNRSAK